MEEKFDFSGRIRFRGKRSSLARSPIQTLTHLLACIFTSAISRSCLKEIFSSVPQGGKWSDFLFDLDISELVDSLCGEAIPFGYADDVALWYEIDVDHSVSIAMIHQDLQALKLWDDVNKTTFEPEKMSAMVVSQKREAFNASGIIFNNEELSVVDETTLVGLVIDRQMRWGPMIKKLAVKARQRIGALSRVRHLLNSENLKMVYTMFIRSIMEYQSTAWMGTAQSHLDKLDRIQRRAEMIGSFTVEPLQALRDAAAMSFALFFLKIISFNGKDR